MSGDQVVMNGDEGGGGGGGEGLANGSMKIKDLDKKTCKNAPKITPNLLRINADDRGSERPEDSEILSEEKDLLWKT